MAEYLKVLVSQRSYFSRYICSMISRQGLPLPPNHVPLSQHIVHRFASSSPMFDRTLVREINSASFSHSRGVIRGIATRVIAIPLTAKRKPRTVLGELQYLKKLENAGTKINFQNLSPKVLEWTRLNLNVTNREELINKYQEEYWYELTEAGQAKKPPSSKIPCTPAERQGLRRDVTPLLTRAPTAAQVSLGLVNMLCRLCTRYHSQWGMNKTITESQKKYVIPDPGAKIAVECEVCRRSSIDQNVRWWKSFPQYYVARTTRVCPTPGCSTYARALIPKDSSIPWHIGFLPWSTATMSRKALGEEYYYTSHGSLPQTLHVHCRRCGGKHVEDKRPRWFGDVDPTYLAPKWRCTRCATRACDFVPDDEKIRYATYGMFIDGIRSKKIRPRNNALEAQ